MSTTYISEEQINEFVRKHWKEGSHKPELIRKPAIHPTEVIMPLYRHPKDELSLAVVLLLRCESHVHHKTTEDYRIVDGRLTIFKIDGGVNCIHTLYESSPHDVIHPGTIHWAESMHEPATVFVTAVPAWDPKDHRMAKKLLIRSTF
jgi:mannose-6-phosphate isomerase-like protein (cupin superfamily)